MAGAGEGDEPASSRITQDPFEPIRIGAGEGGKLLNRSGLFEEIGEVEGDDGAKDRRIEGRE